MDDVGFFDRAVLFVDDFSLCNAPAFVLPCFRKYPAVALSVHSARRGTGFHLLLSLSACSAGKPAEKALVRVTAQPVALLNVASSVTLTGDIQARKVTEQSFRVSGKLIKRYVDVGDRVRVGQVLARLDAREQRPSWRQPVPKSPYDSRGCTSPNKTTSVSKCCCPRVIPTSANTRGPAPGSTVRGDLAALQAQQANARDQVAYTELFAAANGVVTARYAEEGQVVQAATAIFSVAHDGEREAVFSAYESLLRADQTGAAVTVNPLGQPEIQLSGIIREITLSSPPRTARCGCALHCRAPLRRSHWAPWSALACRRSRNRRSPCPGPP